VPLAPRGAASVGEEQQDDDEQQQGRQRDHDHAAPACQLGIGHARLPGEARQLRAVQRRHRAFGERHAQPETVGQDPDL
jgi:hypothetical protein